MLATPSSDCHTEANMESDIPAKKLCAVCALLSDVTRIFDEGEKDIQRIHRIKADSQALRAEMELKHTELKRGADGIERCFKEDEALVNSTAADRERAHQERLAENEKKKEEARSEIKQLEDRQLETSLREARDDVARLAAEELVLREQCANGHKRLRYELHLYTTITGISWASDSTNCKGVVSRTARESIPFDVPSTEPAHVTASRLWSILSTPPPTSPAASSPAPPPDVSAAPGSAVSSEVAAVASALANAAAVLGGVGPAPPLAP